MDIEERIDIHTQTRGKTHSANPYLNNKERDEEMEAESVQETMEDEEEMEYNKDLVDTEWKTQSLPSLGRVSSEQTLESSGDEFAALRRTAPTRMLKSRNVSFFRSIPNSFPVFVVFFSSPRKKKSSKISFFFPIVIENGFFFPKAEFQKSKSYF